MIFLFITGGERAMMQGRIEVRQRGWEIFAVLCCVVYIPEIWRKKQSLDIVFVNSTTTFILIHCPEWCKTKPDRFWERPVKILCSAIVCFRLGGGTF